MASQTSRNDRQNNFQRMMVYCHDSVGLGHLRRSLAICEHLANGFPTASFLLATGTPYVPLFKLPAGVDFVKLPSIAKNSDGRYEAKTLGLEIGHLLACRRALLLATVKYFRPTVFLVDKAPLGVCREMIPTLKWIQRNCPETRVVFGMRDIEDSPEATIRQWAADGVPALLEECFDEIWVYGMESVYDVVREYQLSGGVQKKLRYTGYIERRPCEHKPTRREGGANVLVTVGGGTDGESLLRTYFADAAHRVARQGGYSTIIGGPDLPPSVADELRQAVADLPNTTWLDQTGCMSCHMKGADTIVSMGGYNTMCEIASFQRPALIVPRVTPRYEQAIRASRWERLGLIRALDPTTLTPERLGKSVLDMLDRPQVPDRSRLDMRALDRITERFSSMGLGGRPDETALCLQ